MTKWTTTRHPTNQPTTKRPQREEDDTTEGEPKEKAPKPTPSDDDDGDVIMALKSVTDKIEKELMEMYSPPRVTQWAYIEKHKPGLIIGSPMCTMFSLLQNLSK